MALGDVISATASLGTGTLCSIQPGEGVEWLIHNIGHEAEAELYFYDGANSILMDSDTAGGAWIGLFLHCTNSKYYQIKNTNAETKLVSYDGVVTK